jgi:hypothetical protein
MCEEQNKIIHGLLWAATPVHHNESQCKAQPNIPCHVGRRSRGSNGVDLTAHFPDLVDSVTRGKCVASDPVTGADFSDFSLNRFFRDLLGWDKKACNCV